MSTLAVPSEQKHVLSNGIRVLIEELPHVHSASIGFWLDVGSIVERPEEGGACHLIEHMLFKGTETRTPLEIAQSLEVTGGYLNAFTDKENTCFHARVLASEVPLAIEVLADMLAHSLFDPRELKREKTVVIEEIKMYDDTPDDLVHELLAAGLWKEHPLGRPITGTRPSVRGLDRDALLGFMDRFYTPDRLVIAVAGRVDARAVLEQLERLLGDVAANAERWHAPVARAHDPVVVRYRDIEQVHLCVGTRAVAVGDPRRYALALLNCILGGGMSSRLFQEVREKRGLVYSISSYEALYRPAGLFAVTAGMSPKHLSDVLGLIRDEFAKAATGDLTELELMRAKQTLKGALLLSLEVPRHRMSRMAQNELYYGRLIPPEEVLAAIDAVQIEDLTEMASELFQPAALCISAVGPLRKLPGPWAAGAAS